MKGRAFGQEISNTSYYENQEVPPLMRKGTNVMQRPQDLLDGMAPYFYIRCKDKEEKIDKLNFSPEKRGGWKMITKAIFNPQAPQHKIFKENLKRITNDQECLNCYDEVIDTYQDQLREEERQMKLMKRKKNLSQEEKMKLYMWYEQKRIDEIKSMKKDLKSFKRTYSHSFCRQQRRLSDIMAPQQIMEEATADQSMFDKKLTCIGNITTNESSGDDESNQARKEQQQQEKIRIDRLARCTKAFQAKIIQNKSKKQGQRVFHRCVSNVTKNDVSSVTNKKAIRHSEYGSLRNSALALPRRADSQKRAMMSGVRSAMPRSRQRLERLVDSNIHSSYFDQK